MKPLTMIGLSAWLLLAGCRLPSNNREDAGATARTKRLHLDTTRAGDLIASGRADEAADLLAEAALDDPGNVQLLTQLGDALRQARRPREAANAYSAAAKLDPSNLRLEFMAAQMSAQAATSLEQYTDSANALAKLSNEMPGIAMVPLTLAGLQMRFAKFDLARENLRKALELDPNRATAWFNLAVANERLGDSKASEAARRRYQGLLDLQQAVVNLRRQIAADPRNGPLHLKLALSLRRMGDFRGAFAAIEQAATLAPNNPTIQEHYAAAVRFLEQSSASGGPPQTGASEP